MSKRNIIFVIILSAFLYFIHTSTVKAHDTGEVVKDETARLIHQLAINLTHEMFRSMPAILDSISAEMREQIDLKYKCSLQDDYKNKECK